MDDDADFPRSNKTERLGTVLHRVAARLFAMQKIQGALSAQPVEERGRDGVERDAARCSPAPVPTGAPTRGDKDANRREGCEGDLSALRRSFGGSKRDDAGFDEIRDRGVWERRAAGSAMAPLLRVDPADFAQRDAV